jgi:capsular polysaccharide biosynthesis protein
MLTPTHTPDSPAPALDGVGNLANGVFESPSSPAFSAIARYKWLVFALAVLCALGGVVYGRSRQSTYTASATLQVGQVNPNSPGFFGYVQSAGALATAFSRSVEAEPVLEAAEHKLKHRLKLTRAQVIARLSAATIPESPAFRVIATGPTEHAAVALANVAAQAVIAYENRSNSTNPEAASLLREYREATIAYRRALTVAAKLAEQNPKGRPSAALVAAEAERNVAKAKLDAVGVAYTDAISARAPSSGLVSLIAGATSASSNHHSKIEMYGFIGLLVGIVLGCVGAILLGRRRRAAAAPSTLTVAREDAKQGFRAT